MPSKENDRGERLRAARRVVVKLGTSVVNGAGGEVSAARVGPLVRSMAALREEGRQVVLVSSGAVGLGAGRLGRARSRLGDLVTRQACAAVGQSLLMHAYEQLFGAHGVKIAQVLLTEEDFADRRRYGNLRRAVEKLLKFGVLPVVNENDTVSTAELEYVAGGAGRIFSDNDRLAALVASKLEADALILLTDVEGLLTRRPGRGPQDPAAAQGAGVVPVVREVTPELRALAAGPSAGGRGGMSSKLDAAHIAMSAGGVAVIAGGKRPDVLDRIFAGEATDLRKALAVALDSKTQYPAACNAAETLLVHEEVAPHFLPSLVASLRAAGVEVRACPRTAELAAAGELVPATEGDWATEYSDLVVSIKTVPDFEEAVGHIERYGSRHTESIVTEDAAAAARFMDVVDAAGVYHNASTRFADGYRYGLGAELGISTGKLHARGPVGLEGLTTYKYKLSGDGHTAASYSSGERSFKHRKLVDE